VAGLRTSVSVGIKGYLLIIFLGLSDEHRHNHGS
jgi:hypothetical protein